MFDVCIAPKLEPLVTTEPTANQQQASGFVSVMYVCYVAFSVWPVKAGIGRWKQIVERTERRNLLSVRPGSGARMERNKAIFDVGKYKFLAKRFRSWYMVAV